MVVSTATVKGAGQQRAWRMPDGGDDHTVGPVDRIQYGGVPALLRHAAKRFPNRLAKQRPFVAPLPKVILSAYPCPI